MLRNPGFIVRWLHRFSLAVFAIAIFGVFAVGAFAQTTVSTGSIVGTVTDPSGAVVSGATVTVTNMDTGRVIQLTSNAAGAFNSGALAPGNYKVQISAKGFKSITMQFTVQVGNTATANAKLELGSENQVVEVQSSQLQVNTEQATVQGVLTAQQIDNLPSNGRNFLDLAQLEPGVQIQDGQNFDPTKAGFSSISFGGRFGRTARIYVDGVDISDETVGTTTQDIPESAIQEFQLSQSSLDLSNDLTSSGSVNVSTRSGTNQLHGQAFGLFRDQSVGGAASPGGQNLPFQQSQFGGRVGGKIITDRFFYFLDGERTKQDSINPLVITGPLAGYTGGWSQPFRETDLLAKADYNLGHSAHAFYRYTYFSNLLAANAGYGYSIYNNKDYTRNHVVGLDFNTGSFTHSIRFSYLKFQNQISDAVKGSSLPLANLGVTLHIGQFFSGPNLLAPQSTPQSNHQIKYDGSKAIHSHILRYGISYNHIQGGGFASFFKNAPYLSTKYGTTEQAFASANPYGPGGAANPLNYPVEGVTVGNGLGYNTLEPALGFPAGGLGPDNRIGFYFGDNWKVKPNFTLSYGVRYDRDTGRTDSDLPAIPELNAVYPGYGNPVKQANLNFAPQLGFAWDPTGQGKTSIRGGIGIFYENVIWNNVLFDRPLRLRTGAFLQYPAACSSSHAPQTLTTNQGTLIPGPGVCADSSGNPIAIGTAASAIAAFQQLYQSQNPPDLSAANPNFIGNYLSEGIGVPLGVFAPNYKSPRSVQMNIGIQRQISQGTILSVDFLRNVQTHSLLGIDVNHVGDVNYFNKGAAQAAIAATLAGCGVATIDDAIANCNGAPATMADFADNGLTSAGDFGQACPDALGVDCAFGGINPNAGPGYFMFPAGRSVYNGLQIKLTQNVANPMRGMKTLNFQISYSLSRFENSGGAQVGGGVSDSDQDFVISAMDNNNPDRYFGPSLLDRTHQLSFGGYAVVPAGFKIGLTGHFYSPISGTLTVPVSSQLGDGEIFRSDFSGDGTTQDPMPGTHLGNFDRGINASNINREITSYNNTYANQPTPAGKVLISSGLMTLTQLQELGGVAQPLPLAPAGQVNYSWMREVDFSIGWRHTFNDRFTIEPSVNFYNIFNFGNFNAPSNAMPGLLTGPGSGALNGTTPAEEEAYRVGRGTGVYAAGAPRQAEWGMKFTF